MSQAVIDPEQVRRFAAELKRFNGDLRERSASLMARFSGTTQFAVLSRQWL